MTKEERIEKAKDITQTRILTQEEFMQVRKRQLQKQIQSDTKDKTPKRGKKRKAEDSDANMER